jgi:hypothetical protein
MPTSETGHLKHQTGAFWAQNSAPRGPDRVQIVKVLQAAKATRTGHNAAKAALFRAVCGRPLPSGERGEETVFSRRTYRPQFRERSHAMDWQ